MKSSSSSIWRRMRRLINLVLIVGLLAVLAIYLVTISNLGGFLYSESQQEYLAYNASRSIYKAAPSWNKLVLGDGVTAEDGTAPAQAALEPGAFSEWKSRVAATLAARYEEQEGVSVTRYDLAFDAEYQLVYSGSGESGTVEMVFPFPANLETLHDVHFLVDGSEPAHVAYSTAGIRWISTLTAGRRYILAVSYKADGVNRFAYALNQDRRSDVDVVLHVRGVSGTSVTRDSLPTSSIESGEDEEVLAWQYDDLIPNRNIRIELPRRLSFAQRVEQLEGEFALLAVMVPFLVGIFLVTLALLLRSRGVHLRLEAYLLIGLCLVAFYPALTFLSGLVYLYAAAVLALAAISSLVLVFLGISAGWRQTLLPATWLLFVFLGVFSLGQFLPWRGLVFTIGGVALVATFMWLYAQQARRTAGIAELAEASGNQSPTGEPQSAERLPDDESPRLSIAETAPDQAGDASGVVQFQAAAPVRGASDNTTEPLMPPIVQKDIIPQPVIHCPRCGYALGQDFHFCAGCGYNVQVLNHCPACGKVQLLPVEMDQPHCIYCGEVYH